MKTIMIITADTNDGDYIESTNEIKEKDLERIKKISSVIKTKKGHNWENGQVDGCYEENDNVVKCILDMYEDELSLEDLEWFNEFVPELPYGEEQGVHTITSIRILKVEEDINLLK